MFSDGFVEVLAAEQTPEGEKWFQGTADAVRQATRHFRNADAEYFLILAGDHIYRMDFARADRRAHRAQRGHHDRRAAGDARRTPPRWASSDSTTRARSPASRKSPSPSAWRRWDRARRATPAGRSQPRQAVRGVDGHLRLLARRAARGAGAKRRRRLWPGDHPAGALDAPRASVPLSRLLGRRRHGAVVLRRQPDADAARARPSISFTRSGRSTAHRDSCRRRAIHDCHLDEALVAEGAYLDTCDVRGSVVGIRSTS